MIRVKDIKISPQKELTVKDISKNIGIDEKEILEYTIFRRSVDARKKNDIHLVYTVDVKVKNEKNIKKGEIISEARYMFPKALPKSYRPLIVGSGPAGLMCALMLAEAG